MNATDAFALGVLAGGIAFSSTVLFFAGSHFRDLRRDLSIERRTREAAEAEVAEWQRLTTEWRDLIRRRGKELAEIMGPHL